LGLLLCIGIGCGNSDDNPGNAANSNSELYQYSLLYCAWERRCSDAGVPVNHCLARYFNDDTWLENPLMLIGKYAPSIDCLKKAKSCNDVAACVPTTPCTEGDVASSCQQDTLILCGKGNKYKLDCAKYGATCTVKDTAEPGTGFTCKLGEQKTVCVDNVTVVDEPKWGGNIFWVVDCAAVGMSCSPEIPLCHQPGAETVDCSNGTHCSGNKLIDCYKGKGEKESLGFVLDCSELHPDATCFLDKNEIPRCGQPNENALCSSNNDETDVAECDGSVLKLCRYGVYVTFDCATLGASCVTEDDGGLGADCK
jgi:hypothetical protein